MFEAGHVIRTILKTSFLGHLVCTRSTKNKSDFRGSHCFLSRMLGLECDYCIIKFAEDLTIQN